jgi:type IV pilus assembly protein PilB
MIKTIKKRLGEVLRERNQISRPDLDKAIEDQKVKVSRLGELMLERGLVQKKDLIAALFDISQIPYLDCASVEIDSQALKRISRAMAKRCCVLPIECRSGGLVVAMSEPQNLQILDELRFSVGMNIIPRLAFRREIEAAIEKWYGTVEESGASSAQAIAAAAAGEDSGMEFISSSSLQRNVEAMREMQAEMQNRTTPAVHVVASMITAAAAKRASDIHIEPQSTDTAIRFRVDGILRDFQRIPRSLQNSVASRIKILSDMDISERRTPQDGRFLVKIAGRKIDLRVSTLPTQYGEKVVMRLLESDAPLQSFAALGIPEGIAEAMTRILAQPQGMLLVTGPTGSGKSTTLYSSLNIVRRPAVNIVTVEDPVEYAVPGLNQVQVNTKAGLTFASSLRSILRQDPDVIMVGEIRDKETAEIALKAAQTGHLVLSTLHTNDSISAVTRLLDLGIPGFQVATSVTGIIGQRLVRRLCACRRQVPANAGYASRLLRAGIAEPPRTECVPEGCDECDRTGYKGRVGIYEMLVFDEAIRATVREDGRSDGIRAAAKHNGMRLMLDYALDLVHDGLTTLDEVQRVVPFDHVSAKHCSACQRELTGGLLFCSYCGEKSGPEPEKFEDSSLVEQGAMKE